MEHISVDPYEPTGNQAIVASQVRRQISGRKTVAVPLLMLRPGESPRLKGEDQSHVARLAETEACLPPILVERRSMRVIDGMHRVLAASLRGQETVDAEFFDGSTEDAFLHAVKANVTHGLPLSLTDRRAAAARIIASHPHMSDRAIGQTTGLAARTVAGIRRRSTDGKPQLNARVGRDGRVRPLSGLQGRRRAAALLAEQPDASLREIARRAGVSPATARDVRSRVDRGEEPAPIPLRGRASRPGKRRVVPSTRVAVERLLKDPSLRHNEQGRRLLRALQVNAVEAGDLAELIAAVPSHCAATVAQVARQYAQMWLGIARGLDERARIIEPLSNVRTNSRN